jgi:O-succinylbenzoic acid--CoA ligase
MTPETDWLATSAAADPARPALWHGGVEMDRCRLQALADRLAQHLGRLDPAPGTRVALLACSGPGPAIAVHAVPRAGAVLVPLGTRLVVAELVPRVQAAGARFLVYDAHHAAPAAAVGRATGCELLQLEDLLERAAEGPAPGPSVQTATLPEVHSVLFTSGTSGAPRGVPLTRANHLHCALAARERLGLSRDDHWLACMPLDHVGGLAILLRAAILGLRVSLTSRFDPVECLELLERRCISLVSLVPTMLADLLQAARDRPPPPGLRCVLLGGARAGADLLERAAAAAWPVATTYGLTEAASQVATRAPGGPSGRPPRPGEAGPPLAGVDVRIAGATGAWAPPGEEGEILIRGPSVSTLTSTSGQVRPRPGDRPGSPDEGWLATGDIGRLDSDGTLWVEDRREDRIVSGGENVSPAELEAVLARHPDVAEVCVVACPDPRWGQVPAAFVVPAPGREVDTGQLQAHCRERLAGFKVPRQILPVGSIPRTASGKPRRAELRAALAGEHDPG